MFAPSPKLTTPIKDLILSINRARNCLVHRQGIVADQDANTPDGLLGRWFKMELVASGPEGERVVGAGDVVNAGEVVKLRQTETSKLFRLGDRVIFSAQDFNDICMTFFRFCEALTALVEGFGKSKGVKFADTTPTDATSAEASDSPDNGGPGREPSGDDDQ